MSFITESKKAYKQVKENHVAIAMGNMLDDEGSMILNQLEELERGINMLRDYVGKDYEKQLPAWVQSKVTLATDYISTVGNYLSSKNEKATEESIKESFSLEENTFEKIYKMQQDGKSTEDIAKELKLNPALVKKVLGENTIISEGLSDTQISQLKKEYEPLKGKTITTSQYQQLKNILFKLQDGDLEKLQKQNIPFASTGAGSILRARKSPVKITSVKVPGLEGMAEEKIDLQEKPSRKKHVVFKVGDKLVAKDFRGYNDDEIAKSIDDFLKQNSKSIVVQQSPIQSVTEEPNNPYAIGMAAAMKATGDTPPLKKSTITKAHKIADKVKEEEVEIEENISQVTTKKNGADTDIFYKGKHIGYFHKITSQYGEGKIGNYFVYHDNEDDPEDFTQSDEVSSEAQAKKVAYDTAKFNGLIEEVETVEEAAGANQLTNLNDKITRMQMNLSKLDMAKPESKTKEAIIKSDLTTAKLRLQDLMQKRNKETEKPMSEAKKTYKSMKKSVKKEEETPKKTMTDKPLTKIDVDPKLPTH